MKTVYPDYYNAFKCSACECKDTCCAGWEITVDSDSRRKYSRVGGAFGERLRREMKVQNDGTAVFTLNDSRCPFLDSAGLCDIYSELGEAFLCYTCRMFPRFVETFGAVREYGLGLACPEAARLIINRPVSCASFVSEFTDEPAEPNEIIPELYLLLVSMRQKLFDLMRDERYSFDKRLIIMLKYTESVQRLIDEEEYSTATKLNTDEFDASGSLAKPQEFLELLLSLECLNKDWHIMLSRREDFNCDMTKNSDALKNIADYFIYRYFLKAVYDGDIVSKSGLCAFACIVINGISRDGDITECARAFSKEVEYSDLNISAVLKQMKNFKILRG